MMMKMTSTMYMKRLALLLLSILLFVTRLG
ncbi:hypothetical protein APED_29230 [Acanthopleuribacter pedis]